MMKLNPVCLTTSFVWVTLIGAGMACDLATVPDSLEYSLQADNRCEGIVYEFEVRSALDFVSLSSYREGELPNTLDIQVPALGTDAPYLRLNQLTSGYRLDNLRLNRRGNLYVYALNTRLMRSIGVTTLAEIQAIAISGAQQVRLPTLLGNPSNGYSLKLYSGDNVQFISAGIRSQETGRVYQSWGEQLAHSGEHIFTWADATAASRGRYEFYYIAEIEQSTRAPERVERTIIFEHDPNWLR